MIKRPEQQAEVTSVRAGSDAPEPAPALRLLIDQYLPRYDLAVVHAEVFYAPPQAC